ncbi:MAG: sortase [Candidatus Paceibacterota bacterium]
MGEKITEIKKTTLVVLEHKWEFLPIFLAVFFILFSIASLIGFVPEPKEDSVTGVAYKNIEKAEASEVVTTVVSANPVHITIPSVGVDVNVENPESREIAVLDSALNKGAVRYPGTGSLTEDANIFIFGHSSFLPNVINKNYQAFNGLKRLKGGEEIFVDSADTRYVYRVSVVAMAQASEIKVDLSQGVRKLTLSTCNSFGSESERYIVEADFVGSYSLTI